MLKRSNSLVAIIFLSGTLALISVACSNDKQTKNQTESAPVNNTTGAPTKTLHSKEVFGQNKEHNKQIFTKPQPSQYELALDKADGALSISQSAQSPYDWQLVESQWTEAIALMQTLPNNSPDKAIAKTKIAQYQRYLLQARQKAQTVKSNPDTTATPEIPVILPQSPPEQAVEIQPASSFAAQDSSVFQATIKRRIGGTPVIDVTFNGTSTFEMIVDTGASGTVLTQETANALGLIAVAKAKANTASAKAVEFPIGYVDSIQVAGALVKDVPVAIAPDQVLETGLLGHDFFGNYDVTIKRDVVEFRPR